jgi:hypothetical protein
MTEAPAFVRNGRLDILYANRLARALYSPVYADPARPANLARFAFLDPRATEFYPDWEDAAHNASADALKLLASWSVGQPRPARPGQMIKARAP